MMNMKNEQMNYERALVFFKKQIPVHISKVDNVFYNGIITEVDHDCFFINDFEDGSKLIFFKELKKPIEEYTIK